MNRTQVNATYVAPMLENFGNRAATHCLPGELANTSLGNQPMWAPNEAAAVKTVSCPLSEKIEPSDRRNQRKLRLLKRSGLFSEDTGGATVQRACTLEDLREAYRLVHHVYTETGYIYSHGSGLRLRIFEAMPETATFVAKVKGRIVGVLSVVGDTPELGLPSDAAFEDEIDRVRALGLRLCEMTNQAVAEEFRKSSVPTELMRCAMAHAFQTGYDKAIAAVSSSHNGFYQLLGFHEIGSERSYSDEIDDPVVALCVDADFYRQRVDSLNEGGCFIQHFMTDGNPFMGKVGAWSIEAHRRFMNGSLLRQLFITEGAFITNCTIRELRALERLWGSRTFSIVTGRSIWSATQNWVQAFLNVLHLVDDISCPIRLPSPAL